MKRFVIIALTAGAAALAGCAQRPITNTPRSAIEQMLLSGAVDRALDKVELHRLRRKKVYVDFQHLECYDKPYVQLAARVRIGEMGAILTDNPEEADAVVQIASGALGTEFKTSVVGMPAMPVPNNPVATPEVTAYSSGEQTGIVKLLVAVFEEGRLTSAMHCYAKCDREESFLFGVRFNPTDQVREGWDEAEFNRQLQREREGTRETK